MIKELNATIQTASMCFGWSTVDFLCSETVNCWIPPMHSLHLFYYSYFGSQLPVDHIEAMVVWMDFLKAHLMEAWAHILQFLLKILSPLTDTPFWLWFRLIAMCWFELMPPEEVRELQCCSCPSTCGGGGHHLLICCIVDGGVGLMLSSQWVRKIWSMLWKGVMIYDVNVMTDEMSNLVAMVILAVVN
jgi:hypothetical protein